MNDNKTTIADALAAQFVRIGYVVVNVTNLERSCSFYQNVTPLRVRARTQAKPQPFKLLGIEQGSFDGYLMDDQSGGDPTAVHLIEWQNPAPRGTANPTFFHAGWGKMGFSHNGAEGVLKNLAAHGVQPSNKVIQRNYVSITDPDGVILSFLPNARPRPQLFHVVSGPTDLARTVAFYCELFGLEYWMKNQPQQPLPTSQGPGADMVQWDSHILRGWGDHRFNLDVSKILHPPQAGSVNPDPLNIGIGRIGIEVRDIDIAFRLLERALGEKQYGAAKLIGPIEEWDLGEATPKRRVAALKDPDGMHIDIYQPERVFYAMVPAP